MTPHAFYKGRLRDMRAHLGEPKAFCAYPVCGQPFTPDRTDYCSDRHAEDHDTVQKGGTPLPEHEQCNCGASDIPACLRVAPVPHAFDCPRYVPHPEDDSHPMENET